MAGHKTDLSAWPRKNDDHAVGLQHDPPGRAGGNGAVAIPTARHNRVDYREQPRPPRGHSTHTTRQDEVHNEAAPPILTVLRRLGRLRQRRAGPFGVSAGKRQARVSRFCRRQFFCCPLCWRSPLWLKARLR